MGLHTRNGIMLVFNQPSLGENPVISDPCWANVGVVTSSPKKSNSSRGSRDRIDSIYTKQGFLEICHIKRQGEKRFNQLSSCPSF